MSPFTHLFTYLMKPITFLEDDSLVAWVLWRHVMRDAVRSSQKSISAERSPVLFVPSLSFIFFSPFPFPFPSFSPPQSGLSDPAKEFGGALLAPPSGEEPNLQPTDMF